jgi:arylsulfatase A-like enzyme
MQQKMNKTGLGLFVWTMLFLSACDNPQPGTPPANAAKSNLKLSQSRPNILLIVVDDLGYSDLGVFGGEINTPNIDALASEGMLLTNFHTASVCSPTRSMLLSGIDNHLAGQGNMAEAMADNQKGKPGYEGYLNFRIASMPALLKDANYRTYMAGKWHLGLEQETSPYARGFDRSFALLDGGAGHFTDLGIDINKKTASYREDNELVPLPEDFYSTRSYTDKLIEYISSGQDDEQPFFAYLAYTAPHWPLQAPTASIEKYKGKYDAGYDVIHAQRIKRMQEKGLIPAGMDIAPRLPGESAWEDLSDDAKKYEARMMEIYAAMVDDIDVNIGRLLKYLQDINERENTLIVFMSDNGAEAAPLDDWPVFGDWMEECCDNSYDNMGKADSYLFYGQNWGRVSTGPFRAYKGFASEGGVRAPAFINYKANIQAGQRNNSMISVMDIMPTMLELAGTSHPGTHYKGREVYPIQGRSLMPIIVGEAKRVRTDEDWLGAEVFDRRSITQGDWKLLLMEPPWGNGEWELYNLKNDPAEQHNLAASKKDRLQTMIELWKKYESENGIIFAEGGTVF